MVLISLLTVLVACGPEPLTNEPSQPQSRKWDDLQTVVFSDANLGAAIKNALVLEGMRRKDRALAQKPLDEPITTDELAMLTIIEARSKQISNLSGIEYCANLAELYLTDNNIADISSLSPLLSLTKLDLGANQISDISSLASLIRLKELDLYHNRISDITALASLTNLTHLFLFRNSIHDISALSNLSKLDELDLYGNEIDDVSPLLENEGLSNGDFVRLAENNLDLTPGSADMADIQALKDRGVAVVLE